MSAKHRTKVKSSTSNAASRAAPNRGALWHRWLCGGALVLLVLVTYSRAFSCGFLWDDDYYVETNPTLRTVDGLRRIWLERGAVPQYYPLVHTTFWVEYHLWELRASGYHVVNALLHGTAVVLLWRLLIVLGVPGAWLAAALFAVHPVEVESVAWITERKNVLSLTLALASLLCYLRFAPPEENPFSSAHAWRTNGRWPWYALALCLFVAALLSKTVTASLPAVLLVIYWWKRGRVRWRDVAPLLPFFAAGLALASVTVGMEKNTVGAVGEAWNLNALERCLVAGRALWFYAGKLIWPVGLNFFYPRWQIDIRDWWQYVFPAGASIVIVALWLGRGHFGRGPLAAVLIFSGVLVPALGFFDVYPFRFSFVADHFQYHASAALIALAASGAAIGWRRMARVPSPLAACAAAAAITVLAILSWQRTAIYRSQFTLFDDVVKRDPASWIGHNNLGSLHLVQGDLPKAVMHLGVAARLKPRYVETHNSLALALAEMGDCRAAIELLERALAIADAPDSHRGVTYNNLASILATCRDVDLRDPRRAVRMAEEALRLLPDSGPLYNTLGVALYRAGEWEPSLAAIGRSIELRGGGDSSDRFVLAMACQQLGRRSEARRWYDEGVALHAVERATTEGQALRAEAGQLLGPP